MIEIRLGGRKYPGRVALVDDADYGAVSAHSWCPIQKDKAFYAVARIQGSFVYLHQFIVGDRSQKVDHINRDGLDNRRENLRFGTDSEHSMNRSKQANNTSGYIGVHWSKAANRWEASINANKRRVYLGLYNDPARAALARDRAALELHGKFAVLNFSESLAA